MIFIGCNFESRASQVGLHKQKKDTASAKKGKVRLQRSSRRTTSKGCALDLTAQDLPRATENIREFKIRRLRTTNYGGRALPYVCSTGLSRENIER